MRPLKFWDIAKLVCETPLSLPSPSSPPPFPLSGNNATTQLTEAGWRTDRQAYLVDAGLYPCDPGRDRGHWAPSDRMVIGATAVIPFVTAGLGTLLSEPRAEARSEAPAEPPGRRLGPPAMLGMLAMQLLFLWTGSRTLLGPKRFDLWWQVLAGLGGAIGAATLTFWIFRRLTPTNNTRSKNENKGFE